MPQKFSILWADDEIDLLKPHLLFLRKKDYDVTTANNGYDALELVGCCYNVSKTEPVISYWSRFWLQEEETEDSSDYTEE